ncbi:hypothetical protein [Bacillus phage FI_KG-Lek]|nr:hypothetical protein [Bacillus phage FI_KG-Lek]
MLRELVLYLLLLASVGGIAGIAAGAVGFLGSALAVLTGPIGLVAALLSELVLLHIKKHIKKRLKTVSHQ